MLDLGDRVCKVKYWRCSSYLIEGIISLAVDTLLDRSNGDDPAQIQHGTCIASDIILPL